MPRVGGVTIRFRATMKKGTPMDLPEFLQALPHVKAAGYSLYTVQGMWGNIVRLRSPNGDEHCFITAVCAVNTGLVFSFHAANLAAVTLGIPYALAKELAAASDGEPAAQVLRQQCLAMLGVRIDDRTPATHADG